MNDGLKLMTTRAVEQKLKDLRAKTDRELIALIDRQLERGMQADYARAGRFCQEVCALWPLVYSVTKSQRTKLEVKLSRLAKSCGVSLPPCVQLQESARSLALTA